MGIARPTVWLTLSPALAAISLALSEAPPCCAGLAPPVAASPQAIGPAILRPIAVTNKVVGSFPRADQSVEWLPSSAELISTGRIPGILWDDPRRLEKIRRIA